MGSVKYHLQLQELKMTSTCYLLTALLLLLPLTSPHPSKRAKFEDEVCVIRTLSCFNNEQANNVTAAILNLPSPNDCGKACQEYNRERDRDEPECVFWTMFHPTSLLISQCFLLENCVIPTIDGPITFTGNADCPPYRKE